MRRGAAVPDGGAYMVDLAWARLALPGLVLMCQGFGAPMLLLAGYSVLRDGGNGAIIPELTFSNYVRILSDSLYLRVLAETVLLGALVAFICAALAYPLAYFLVRTRSRFRAALMFLMLTPLLVSSVIRNIGWIPILGDHGAVNFFLLALHIIDRPLTLMNNLAGVVIALVHALLPFMTLLLMTVIQRIDPAIEDAARSLGASPWRLFWRVVLPLSSRGLAAGAALVFAISVSSYTTPTIMGGGKLLVMATFIVQQVQIVLRYAFGAALTMVLFAAALGLSLLGTQWFERKDA